MWDGVDGLMRMGSEAVRKGEVYFDESVGEEERDWNSGDEAVMGALEGIWSDIRRWRASFWADRSMYFCIDSFWGDELVMLIEYYGLCYLLYSM